MPGLDVCASTTKLYMGSEDSNSAGPRAYVASTLPTELSPQPSTLILTQWVIAELNFQLLEQEESTVLL